MMTTTQHTDPDFIPALYDGLEVTSDGYDIWVVYRDGGVWWASERSGERQLMELCPCPKEGARVLTERGYTRA